MAARNPVDRPFAGAYSDSRKQLTEDPVAQAASAQATSLQTAALNALASRFITTDEVPWVESTPGNKMKVIYHDPATGLLTILSRLEPGCGIPAHVHEDLEQTYVIEGSLVDDEGECTAGNFVIRPKGSRHSPTAPNGCTMLVFFLKPTEGLKKALFKRG
jgi:anti-sigma factor ChrR (cupin superfamily)